MEETMKGNIKWAAMLTLILVFGLFYGCSNNPTAPADQNGSLSINLTDSPASFDAVYIVVTKVEVNESANASSSDSGWVTLNSTPQTYDLLTLKNGTEAVLGDTVLSPGQYNQIRLVIGSGSYVLMNGIRVDLTIPSGIQTGVKLIHQFNISANTRAKLTLDFDASRSIVIEGNGNLKLKPTIRIVETSNSGTISGKVFPQSANPIVWTTTASNDTVTAYPDSSGYFMLNALPAGVSYNVVIHADNTVYSDTTISNISVNADKDTDIGAITLTKN
jgi:hypothetical protein